MTPRAGFDRLCHAMIGVAFGVWIAALIAVALASFGAALVLTH
jgi:hypothetical protein